MITAAVSLGAVTIVSRSSNPAIARSTSASTSSAFTSGYGAMKIPDGSGAWPAR